MIGVILRDDEPSSTAIAADASTHRSTQRARERRGAYYCVFSTLIPGTVIIEVT